MKSEMGVETSGQKRSLWLETSAAIEFSILQKDLICDVCIVGAGIAGLSTALSLVRKKKSVIVIDDGNVGGGETGRTSAHLTNILDDRYYILEDLHGEEGARLAAESHAAAIDFIDRTVREEKIACDFERVAGYLFLPPDGQMNELEKEFEATKKAGLDVEWVTGLPWHDANVGKCLRFSNQAQFHPLKYLTHLSRLIQKEGGQIFTSTHVTEFKGGPQASVKTTQGNTIQAGAIVLATNVPVNDRVIIHTKQAAYRSYVIGAKIPKGSVPHALYWDTPDPYHYVRVQVSPENINEEILIVGGEDQKTGQIKDDESPYQALESWARKLFPMITSVDYQWSGQIIEPVDGLAFIGRNPLDESNVYIVTGDSGNGLTHGTIAGILITDLIMGRDNPWASLYDPSRKTLRSAKDYVKGIANVIPQYADWITGGDVKSEERIAPGTGKIVRRGLKKIAAYRDENNQLHEYSATCPHLGGVVRWNMDEKTWDCPCHGSRFTCDGKVVNGPANSDLTPVLSAENKEEVAERTNPV